MRRQLRVRTLFLLSSLATLGIAAGFAYYTVPDIIAGRLPAGASDAVVADAVSGARQAILLGGVLAFVAALLLSLGAGTLLGQAMRRLRYGAVRVIQTPGERSMPTFVLTELDRLAATFARAAREKHRRLEAVARERDEAMQVLDSVGEGILQVSADGRIVRVNRMAEEMLHLPEDEDVVGRPAVSFVRQAPLRELLTRAARGEPATAREVAIDDRRVLVVASPLRGDEDDSGAAIVFVDLTELRRLEGVRRDFVANASHELKTPLTSIRGYSETLLQDDVPEELRRRFLESVHQNADRLHRIVEDLLDLSRLESGNWEPEYEEIHPARAADEVWEGFAERADEAGIEFRVENEVESPVPVDRIALAQILSNLFDNAVRYTAEGTIAVRVAPSTCPDGVGGDRPAAAASGFGAAPRERRTLTAAGRLARAGGRRSGSSAYRDGEGGRPCVSIEVIDTGTGIPTEARARIFERFYRVDPARSRAEGGTGLGLAIVKHLVESMDGRIEVDSALGKGTRVRVVLPARRD